MREGSQYFRSEMGVFRAEVFGLCGDSISQPGHGLLHILVRFAAIELKAERLAAVVPAVAVHGDSFRQHIDRTSLACRCAFLHHERHRQAARKDSRYHQRLRTEDAGEGQQGSRRAEI